MSRPNATWYKSPNCGTTITCGRCSRESPIEEFFKSETGDLLPREHYRCPQCGIHFKRHHYPPYFCLEGPWAGRCKPGPVEIREVQS